VADQPTPLQRLLLVEAGLEQLNRQLLNAPLETPPSGGRPVRQPWPAEEQLLTRCLRRTPQVLIAYQTNAELTDQRQGRVLLEPSAQPSPLQLCELSNGDAVVWLSSQAPDLLLDSPSLRLIYDIAADVTSLQQLTVQRLPLFKAIMRGRSWTLARKGELRLKTAPHPEEAMNAAIDTRLERLEKEMDRLSAKQHVARREMAVQLQTQQEQLDQLLRLKRS